jgi:hypothetical protein
MAADGAARRRAPDGWSWSGWVDDHAQCVMRGHWVKCFETGENVFGSVQVRHVALVGLSTQKALAALAAAQRESIAMMEFANRVNAKAFLESSRKAKLLAARSKRPPVRPLPLPA